VLMRKGGLEDPQGLFHLAQPWFWLWPTWTHQQPAAIQESFRYLWNEETLIAPSPVVPLQLVAEAVCSWKLRRLETALAVLPKTTIYSREEIQRRFHYRKPELTVVLVRVYEAAQPHLIPDSPQYQGCRSWVGLDQPLSTGQLRAVTLPEAFRDVTARLSEELDREGPPLGTAGGLPELR
jgi:hypothetical protein